MTYNRLCQFALAYHRRGWPVIPIPYKRKGPTIGNWKALRYLESDILLHFNGAPTNIGVLLGEPSGLIDIDLDCPESRALAVHLLPLTDMRFGRNGSPNSHWIYTGEINGQRTSMFKGPDGESLLELRANGSQTLFPPSIHPNGDEIGFESKDDPAHVDIPKLLEAVHELAAGCLLLRQYPAQGSRHDYALAIAGGLLRASWPVDRVQRYLEVIAVAAGDEEVEDRVAAVGTTHRAIRDGRETTGWPRVHEIIDGSEPKQQYVGRIRRHLGIDRKPAQERRSPESHNVTLDRTPVPITREPASTEPYRAGESRRAVDRMAATARQLREVGSTLAEQVAEWLDRRGPETLDGIDYPIPYAAKAIGVSRCHFHRLGQIGRVRRCCALRNTPLALSDRAILPLARLLTDRPEAIPQAVEAACDLVKLESKRKGYDKPKPVNTRHTATAVDEIIGPAQTHTPVRRRLSPDPDTAAAKEFLVYLAKVVDLAAILQFPPDLIGTIKAVRQHPHIKRLGPLP